MIYFLQNGAAVKIGYAADANQRTDYLQTGSPHHMEVLGVIDGGYEDEARLHQRFSHLHIRGEWFRLEKDLIFFLGDVLNPQRTVRLEHGDAPQGLTVTKASSAEVQLHDNSVYVAIWDEIAKKVSTVLRLTRAGKILVVDNRHNPMDGWGNPTNATRKIRAIRQRRLHQNAGGCEGVS